MKWSTWEKIGIDRQACAWFIKRFVDKDAIFEFIPRDAVIEDAEHSFDTPSSKWTHKKGRSTFHMFVRAYAPKDAILKKMAEIVDGADTASDILPPPEAYGLEAICLGLRSYAGNDDVAVKQSEIIYEALYAYLREKEPPNQYSPLPDHGKRCKKTKKEGSKHEMGNT